MERYSQDDDLNEFSQNHINNNSANNNESLSDHLVMTHSLFNYPVENMIQNFNNNKTITQLDKELVDKFAQQVKLHISC